MPSSTETVDGPGAGPGPWPDVAVPALRPRWGRVVDGAAVAGVALAGVVLRVVQRSPLWLDEALSANIAELPLGDIAGALRRDGHPPLYYVLLHGWQEVVGDTATAARLLSGAIGLALVPLAWVAAGRIGGRRAAWAAVLLVALNPFVLRYATEARMYELVMVLALAGWLVADRALHRPTAGRLAALTALTGALLWTHYWGIWLTAAAGVGLLARAGLAQRRGEAGRRTASLRVAAALVVGAATFLPWLPNLLYQSAHTGTPWALPSVPTETVASSLLDLAGGNAGESVLLAMALVVLVLLGLFGRPAAGSRIELDLRTRPEARRLALLVAGTLAVATVASYAAQAAYASRYFAVVAPLVLVLAGVGAARISGPVAFRVVLAGVLLLGAVAGVRAAVSDPRTQAGEIARAIEAEGPAAAPDGPLVLVCPDQLGPALGRELPPGTDIATYPEFARPELVDWVDYTDRVAAADPLAFAEEALRRAGPRDVWLVWSGQYRTHVGTCEDLAVGLQRGRPAGVPVVVPDPDAYEAANAHRYPGG
ncbi:MAG TPA: glycosyltransferase family 39 protein [Acidimicrobiales bacterium]|nr:glycosyltransferase family 39 protein [Acidimicrobiales bacterium]